MTLSAIGDITALVLTIFVFTFLLADFFPPRIASVITMPYRLAVYIFTGLTAGFVAIVTFDSAIRPWLDDVQQPNGPIELLVRFTPLLLALALLLPNGIPLVSTLRRLALAFLIGAGAAVAVVGAVSGTLIPLTVEAGESMADGLLLGSITVVGVVCTLAYFQYGARRTPSGDVRQNPFIRFLRGVGSVFLAVALGTFYAAAIGSTLTVFSERLRFLLTQIFGG